MEEESFDAEEIARFINGDYLIIKVDREARPDVDAVYMSGVQETPGSGALALGRGQQPTARPSCVQRTGPAVVSGRGG